MLASDAPVGRVHSAAVVGLQALDVTVEVSMSNGLPAFTIIGTVGAAARQAADRVRAALAATGIRLPARRILASLAPADVPTAGARFDLPLAAAVLVRLQIVPATAVAGAALLGELALDGSVRPVTGVLPSAARLLERGTRRLFVGDDNAAEAALVTGLDVVAVADLTELVAVSSGKRPARVVGRAAAPAATSTGAADLADVRGQAAARRALEIAAAGGHHLLLLGPPGCGKSMLARRLPGVLPLLTETQTLELLAIRSVAGLLPDGAEVDRRPPLRAPHHATSAAALLGGGSGVAQPGEISLATHGALFLDELFEWPRRLLDALREPLEDGRVRLARTRATVTYPAAFQLVCAANPCPCGGGQDCACSDADVWRYRRRLSGPLADRIDLAPHLAPLGAEDVVAVAGGEPSAAVARRVATARACAVARWERVNARVDAARVRTTARRPALLTLARAVETGTVTGRGFDRALRVARTCADLEGADVIGREHVLEALAHRAALRDARPAAAR